MRPMMTILGLLALPEIRADCPTGIAYSTLEGIARGDRRRLDEPRQGPLFFLTL